VSKSLFLGKVREDIIEPMAPFFKAWGHGGRGGFLHDGSLT
jgi:hypothetical protein